MALPLWPALGGLVLGATLFLGGVAMAEQAGAPASGARTLAGQLDAGDYHTCAILDDGTVRCWGAGHLGRLGYGNEDDIGDDETPRPAGPVDLGAGRTATALSAGGQHTCAILDNGKVRCWGYGLFAQLGSGNTDNIGDDETPGAVGTVDLGVGLTATAITAGGFHTCVILNTGMVRCWGSNNQGELGYGNEVAIGDDETPNSVGTVDLGSGRTATAISAGGSHTCAILDDGSVRCWGWGLYGQLGYGNTNDIGDNETPGTLVPVALGAGRTATALSAGGYHTCAILDDGTVRCWGWGALGQLGYGNTQTIGDDETPGTVVPVDLGAGRTATAIAAGSFHTCALLDDGTVRCWGLGDDGRLGYANTTTIGDTETPGAVGPVDISNGRTTAVTAGEAHTCSAQEHGRVRCWGRNDSGQLGYGNVITIGDNETPHTVGSLVLGGRVQ